MKVGDLVKVSYSNKNPYDQSFESWGKGYIGVVIETPGCHDNAVYKMWCLRTGAVHILMPDIDLIEMINESR